VSTGLIKFAEFVLDCDRYELLRAGRPVKLEKIPMELLILLVEKDGHLVTRHEIVERLWGSNVFVDTEHGINTAVRKIRLALRDDVESPRFLQTVSGKGYRFVAPRLNGNNRPEEASIENPPSNSTISAPLELSPLEARHSRPGRVLATSAIVGIVVVLAALVAYRFRLPGSSRYDTLKAVPFTTYPGLEIAPSFSPDGSQIVFWWSGEPDRGNPAGLYVKQLGNEKAVQLTEDSSCVKPEWSPDGRLIAFSRSNKDGSGIYLIPSLGGAVRKLTSTQQGCDRFSYLSWSSDSRWLAFPDLDEQADASKKRTDIYILNVETLEGRMIPAPSPDCIVSWMPAFSPDGKSLAMVCATTHEVGGIFLEPAMGGPAHKILHVEGTIHGLAWTPDSHSLVYALDGNLWHVSISGGALERLPASDAFAPAIAKNGNRLAYARVRENRNIWRLDLASPVTVKHAATKIITSTARQTGPRISPNGRHIAFESDRSGSPEIWKCDSDGSNPVQMTSFQGAPTGTVRWSPDSRWLVFDSRATGRPELYVLSAEGGSPRLVLTGTEDATDPFWSADNRWIYFATEKNRAIWKVPASGGNAIRLTDSDGFNPQESADGTRIYYVRGQNRVNIWWVSPTGGASHHLDGMPSPVAGDHWTPSKNGIYFINGDDSPATLNLFDPATRRIAQISTVSGNPQGWGLGLNVSSDGHSLLYSEQGELAGNIMLVENFH
jgi:Tol biopolymer transport system component/DNA-binding winged helix-turn-helix (wHTH) protein